MGRRVLSVVAMRPSTIRFGLLVPNCFGTILFCTDPFLREFRDFLAGYDQKSDNCLINPLRVQLINLLFLGHNLLATNAT